MLLARQRVEDYSHLTNENKFLPLLEGEISQTSHLNLKRFLITLEENKTFSTTNVTVNCKYYSSG